MTAHTLGAASAWAPLRLSVHLLVGVTVAIVAPFTGFAWPFALAVGMALGANDARGIRGERPNDSLGSALGVALGIIAMLFFGAIVGGIIAIVVVLLASFSERAAAYASPTDRGVARILLFLVPLALWLVVFPLLGVNVNVRIGG